MEASGFSDARNDDRKIEVNEWSWDGENFINIQTGEKFDRNGYDYSGYDIDGWNKDGWNRDSLNRETMSKYDREGYDINGFDRDGFNRAGLNRDTGLSRDEFSFDKEGRTKDVENNKIKKNEKVDNRKRSRLEEKDFVQEQLLNNAKELKEKIKKYEFDKGNKDQIGIGE